MVHVLLGSPARPATALALVVCLLFPLSLVHAQPTPPAGDPPPLPTKPVSATSAAPVRLPPPLPPVPTQPPATAPLPTTPVEFNVRTQERITNLAANLSTKHEQTIERLTLISNRLGARIALLKKDGMDTVEAEVKLAEVATSLININGLFTDIDARVKAAVSAKDGAAAWRELSTTYTGSSAVILSTFYNLRAIVYLLDPALKNAPPVN